MSFVSTVFAALKIDPGSIGYNGGVRNADEALKDTLTLVYTWAGIIAVLILVIAGFFFVTSRGDPAQMKRSKDAIRGAVIGLVVIMLAFVITQFVLGSL